MVDLAGKAKQIADAMHTASGWVLILIVGLAGLLAVVAGVHFFGSDREGTEKGKSKLKAISIGLLVSSIGWVVMQMLAQYFQGLSS
ncbi:hypothetical protein [Fructobacillus tropaeoli]|uniref:hypothetical protein n=1 Tax=Fructobacillus tropaeoli TaxID=709323 RepID=UPI001942919B|nr:hypothetical protein [Fructobacillus tropaeoli]GIC69410.1 hypothetical protein FT12353_00460 [Fructobacillus tropaeoli]